MIESTRKLVVGIDLGTSTSCISFFDRATNSTKVIGVGQNNANIMPSVVAYRKNAKTGAVEDQPIVGDIANRQMILNPQGTLFQTKRIIGRTADDFKDASEKDWLKKVPYKIEFTENSGPRIIIPGLAKQVTPIDVAARILQELINSAKEWMKSSSQKIAIEQVVITVPAYFNDLQRKATEDAAKVADINIKDVRIVNEPTAAAIAYGIDKKKDSTILVYDMGGGTFDVTIVNLENGVFEILTSSGEAHLGGADFDQRIVTFIEKKIQDSLGIKITDLTAQQRIRDAAETAKKNLSNVDITTIDLPFIGHDGNESKNFSYDLSRAELETLTRDLVDRASELCKKALREAKLDKSQIDEVVLVGGMTRMKKIVDWTKDYFGIEPCKSINPDEVVARGAAIYASSLFKSADDVDSDADEIVVIDVSPLSLGIETLGGIFTPIITKDTAIPTSKSQVFSTAEDNQSQVEIKIYQGERKLTTDNKFLGNFNLVGIKPAPRGIPQIEVTFSLDAGGLLEVTAKDKASGTQQALKVESPNKISEEEIKRMQDDAQRYAQEDEKRKKLAEQKNATRGRMYEATRLLKEVEGDLEKDESAQIHTAAQAVEAALAGDDLEKIEASIGELEKHLPRLKELKANKEKNAESNSDSESTKSDSTEGSTNAESNSDSESTKSDSTEGSTNPDNAEPTDFNQE